uniref:Putative secreted peptide n=1 Tax=Anopheles braziliensis TaxID=58242 RepID=A0A2M3ZW22_9DIPT
MITPSSSLSSLSLLQIPSSCMCALWIGPTSDSSGSSMRKHPVSTTTTVTRSVCSRSRMHHICCCCCCWAVTGFLGQEEKKAPWRM